jgi:hypothetical protein
MKDKILAGNLIILGIVILGGIIWSGIADEITSRKANAEWLAALKFQHREVVELRVGGQGQIIEIHYSRFHQPYLIRIRTDEGFEDRWMHEYEVKQ